MKFKELYENLNFLQAETHNFITLKNQLYENGLV